MTCAALFDAYYTQTGLAKRIVDWAVNDPITDRRASSALEPSFGVGSLLFPLLERVPIVSGVEMHHPSVVKVAAQLRQTPANARLFTIDFLDFHTDFRFDLGVMNPPYGEAAEELDCIDGRHVAHALSMCDRVVALVRANFMNGKKRFDLVHRDHYVSRRVHFTTRPKFFGPSDEGHTARHDFTVVELRRRTNKSGQSAAVEEFWKGNGDPA